MEILFLGFIIFGIIYGDEIIAAVNRWLDIREKEAENRGRR